MNLEKKKLKLFLFIHKNFESMRSKEVHMKYWQSIVDVKSVWCGDVWVSSFLKMDEIYIVEELVMGHLNRGEFGSNQLNFF